MNGSSHSAPSVVEMTLKRGPAGLGFNIVGGVDQQYITNDSGIYVARIKEDGAAALDGRLQEGDKIIAINGQNLDNLSHGAAVELFRSAGEEVHLRVQQGLNLQNGPTSSRADGESSSAFGTWTMYTVVTLAVIAAGFMAYKRLRLHPRASRGPF
ncbi:synaptojanin-2-binding protein-like isoform X2 [Carassius auratus]|uniref:Synaptojanin-2-binding protein n=1 Tax=Carassius auratus TaxID=7957 RepID=A0A6P6QL65_CARAU|nr:synaptojanin-2-binding protein-like isoform X2 [Carassius auratus]XP_052468692.1 synaptojanin-2-binding protein isoform X1 [Carassius gibelio]